VPANRSRTLEWRRCLQQIHERGGAIEIAIDRNHHSRTDPSDGNDTQGTSRTGLDLVWRVRVLRLSAQEIIVEQPVTLGEPIRLEDGVALIGVISVGQNRWMFRTVNLGSCEFAEGGVRPTGAVRLRLPEVVERCQRRGFFRLGTAGLELPTVRLWPLLDPKSVVLAERTNEVRLHAEQNGTLAAPIDGTSTPNQTDSGRGGKITRNNALALTLDDVMPEVGPMFRATMMNIGGGGVGLLVEPGDTATVGRHKLFWMQIDLPPHFSTPLCVTGKVVHTHMESSQQLYVGMAFDFSFNAGHQRFIIDQVSRYIAMQQREQFAQNDRAA
jgi:hypothetical protein